MGRRKKNITSLPKENINDIFNEIKNDKNIKHISPQNVYIGEEIYDKMIVNDMVIYKDTKNNLFNSNHQLIGMYMNDETNLKFIFY